MGEHGLVHGSLCLSVVEDRHAHGDSGRQVDVVFELSAPLGSTHRRHVCQQRRVYPDSGQALCLGYLQAYIAFFDGYLLGFQLGTSGKSLFVDSLKCRYLPECIALDSRRSHHVELLVVGQFEQFLELALVVLQVGLRGNDVVFVLCTLCGELRQLGATHLSDLHHHLSALLVLCACGKALAADVDGFSRIEYLHVELSYLFLYAVGCSFGLEVGLFLGELV